MTQYDGTPPKVISAAMIREAFNLPDDAVLVIPPAEGHNTPIQVDVVAVGEKQPRFSMPMGEIPGNHFG